MNIFNNQMVKILMEQLMVAEKIRENLKSKGMKKEIRAIENLIQAIKDKIDKEAKLKQHTDKRRKKILN